MIDYKNFPTISTDEFEAVSIDALKNERGIYYLTLTFIKRYADEGERNAEGLSVITNIKGLSLQEIDARGRVLYDIGLFDGLHIEAHGTLFFDDASESEVICWNHINDPEPEEYESVEEADQTITFHPKLH